MKAVFILLPHESDFTNLSLFCLTPPHQNPTKTWFFPLTDLPWFFRHSNLLGSPHQNLTKTRVILVILPIYPNFADAPIPPSSLLHQNPIKTRSFFPSKRWLYSFIYMPHFKAGILFSNCNTKPLRSYFRASLTFSDSNTKPLYLCMRPISGLVCINIPACSGLWSKHCIQRTLLIFLLWL